MTMEHQPQSDYVDLTDLNLDANATGVLALFRHFLGSFADPESQSWQMAFCTASERWGAVEGPQTAMFALAVVQAMRRVRPTIFRFANPLSLTCRGMATPDEAALLHMLQDMRRDRTDAARAQVTRITAGRMDPVLIRAGLSLARQMGRIAAPRLQVATHGGHSLLH